jgi:hypothetical protein
MLAFAYFTVIRIFPPAAIGSALLAHVVRHGFKPAFPAPSTQFKVVTTSVVFALLLGSAVLAWFRLPPHIEQLVTVIAWVLVAPLIGYLLYMDWRLLRMMPPRPV